MGKNMGDQVKKSATYLYCLVHAASAPSCEGAGPGLDRMSAPRLLDAGQSLYVVAADAPLSRYGEGPISKGLQDLDWVAACAMAHERVIEHFAAPKRTVIPMKLFTLFSTDARALDYVRAHRTALNRAIKHVSGCQEFGVRIALNPSRAAAAARASAKTPARTSKGTQFLLLKKQERDFTQNLRRDAVTESAKSYRELARHAKDACELPIVHGEGGASVILDAAFLIPSAREKNFRLGVEKLTRRLSASFDVTLSGPWPPYNFVKKAL